MQRFVGAWVEMQLALTWAWLEFMSRVSSAWSRGNHDFLTVVKVG